MKPWSTYQLIIPGCQLELVPFLIDPPQQVIAPALHEQQVEGESITHQLFRHLAAELQLAVQYMDDGENKQQASAVCRAWIVQARVSLCEHLDRLVILALHNIDNPR